jgi:hypothetical protein
LSRIVIGKPFVNSTVEALTVGVCMMEMDAIMLLSQQAAGKNLL